MTSETLRIEPYTADVGVHAPQLEFVTRQVPLLSPDFAMPQEDWRTGTTRQVGEGNYVTTWQFGTGQGYGVTLNETLESRASGVVARGITVETFGLPGGCLIWSKYESSFAHAPYLELRVSGPEEAVAIIVERFREEFGPDAGSVEGVTSSEQGD